MSLALLGGALGGITSFLYLAFGGFKKLPDSREVAGKGIDTARLAFLLARTAFGSLSAFIVGLWFMDDYMTNSIPIFKFLFIAALVGYSTTSLSALASRLRLAA